MLIWFATWSQPVEAVLDHLGMHETTERRSEQVPQSLQYPRLAPADGGAEQNGHILEELHLELEILDGDPFGDALGDG